MAISGTVPARSRTVLDPNRAARWLRRATLIGSVALLVWFFAKFSTRWVPADMDTIPTIPPGSWCVVDRWASGLRVGSDVFVDGPRGIVLSRVAELDQSTVTLLHPNAASSCADSRRFGAVPRSAVLGTVVVALPPRSATNDGR